MSFCPVCKRGQGNGGDPCLKCEQLEARAEALTLDAQKQFGQHQIGLHKCVACETWKSCCYLTEELLCEECFVKTYVETEMQ